MASRRIRGQSRTKPRVSPSARAAIAAASQSTDEDSLRGQARDHLFEITEREIARADGARGGGSDRTIKLDDYSPNDVIEVTLDNGTRLFTTFSQFLNDFPSEVLRAPVPSGHDRLPSRIRMGEATRSGGGLLIKVLKQLGLKSVVDDAATKTASSISDWYERRSLKLNGAGKDQLWRCEADVMKPFALRPLDARGIQIRDGTPLLVLLHGTASSTRGSFHGLWDEPTIESIRAELFGTYQHRIFGFEHRTLTVSPIDNAIALVEALPKNATIHLVSHSRGGMVGELLCRGNRKGGEPISSDDIKLAYNNKTSTQGELAHVERLRKLSRKLREKNLVIDRFVRVACPARSTRLADERVDRWLSVSLGMLEPMVPAGMSDFYDLFKEFALGIIRTRTKPEELPGLQAMMPSSALVKLLNLPGVETTADLHVIAGDIEGGPLWKRLGIWVTDQFYDAQHDLIVHTPPMYGGAQRPKDNIDASSIHGAKFYFVQGPEINHLSYFGRTESARKLLDGLSAKGNDGFVAFDPATKFRGGTRTLRSPKPAEPKGEKPIVVLLPGVMGSELEIGGKKLWLSTQLLLGRFSTLAIENKARAVAPINFAYGALIEELSRTHDVVPFPYDWRSSLRTQTEGLRGRLVQLLAIAAQRDQPVSILAHSMGGLLARILIAMHRDVWNQIEKHPRARLIMLGTPNSGSHSICRLLTGREPLAQALAAVDMTCSAAEVVNVAKRFPGLLELLPTYQDGLDFLEPATWKQLAKEDDRGWEPPLGADLSEARKTRQMLDSQLKNGELPLDRILYVAGCAEETPERLIKGVPESQPHFNDSAWKVSSGEGRLHFKASSRGDGRVLWDTGFVKGSATWYSQASHGDLADHEEDFPAIRELLVNGTTNLLPQQAPTRATRGAGEPAALMRTRGLDLHPDDETLVDLAIGRGATSSIGSSWK